MPLPFRSAIRFIAAIIISRYCASSVEAVGWSARSPTGWRIHDLRRTCVSGMARLGIAPHVADKILNHQTGTISGVAAVYSRWLTPLIRYQLKPPGLPFGRADLRAPDQIAFAHDADKLAFLVDNGRRTDVIVQQDGGDFSNVRVNAHRNDVGDHHIRSFLDAYS
jgi:hypothetical protein